ncbi:hypothetical protein QYF36_009945 [Acer negundo]|nr:hypothetical protein QYF36_009945 [Acer negundo]
MSFPDNSNRILILAGNNLDKLDASSGSPIGNAYDDVTLILFDIQGRCVDKGSVRHTCLKKWSHPPTDCLYFNVDSSFLESQGLAGIGGVLRVSRDMILYKFSSFVVSRDSVSAELLAIQKACQLVSFDFRLHTRRIVIISDSKAVVSWILGDHFGSLDHVGGWVGRGVMTFGTTSRL